MSDALVRRPSRLALLIVTGSLAIASTTSAMAAAPGGRPRPMAQACERMNDRLAHIDRHLTTDRVKDIVEGRIASDGETTLKVGKVTEKDDVIDVDIVTKDGSLVTTRKISAKTGLPPEAGQNCERAGERGQKFREEHPGMGPRQPAAFRPGMRGERAPLGEFLGLGIAGAARPDRDLNLTPTQAKDLAEAALVMAGNARLKVGQVKEKDADTLTVDIVTQDNSLVVRREIDRHTGRAHRAS